MAPTNETSSATSATSAANLQTAQPAAPQSMTLDPTSQSTTQAQAKESQDQEVHMRGGDACPGRFCFIIPCPIPCNFCII
ncbi:hypothetical protein LSUE1_G007436 [Lachnellula suecica]|uniref:Uncharacterized protein n=1 Tax=Lachnellula suecica TaxID=602035 RepID=A0A8T9C1G8_9HELO|nr:hypothetical protein LSUE1_G007436 [Lachnellula suecica]